MGKNIIFGLGMCIQIRVILSVAVVLHYYHAFQLCDLVSLQLLELLPLCCTFLSISNVDNNPSFSKVDDINLFFQIGTTTIIFILTLVSLV